MEELALEALSDLSKPLLAENTLKSIEMTNNFETKVKYVTQKELHDIWVDKCFNNPNTFHATYSSFEELVKTGKFCPIEYNEDGSVATQVNLILK